MTRRDILTTVHEPFGDAYYFGPERIGSRYEDDKQARVESSFSDSTFKTIFDRIENEASEVRYRRLRRVCPSVVSSSLLRPSLMAPTS